MYRIISAMAFASIISFTDVFTNSAKSIMEGHATIASKGSVQFVIDYTGTDFCGGDFKT